MPNQPFRLGHEEKNSPANELLSTSPMDWGQLIFRHHFRVASPLFHHEMLEAAMTSTHLAVASPRESAKSTLLVFLYPFHAVMFRRKRFILIVSNTFKKAAMHLDTMKSELRDNERLRRVHPPVKMPRDAEGDTIFQHPNGFQTLVLCKGVDQIGAVRGVKFGAYRPDLIICDDIEDDELVRNPDMRRQLQQEYDEALIPAGEKGNCQYITVGTVLHDDSQLAKLVSRDQYMEYRKLFYAAHVNPDQADEASLWPEKWSIPYLHQLRKEKPTVYAKEYQNDPVAASNTRFKREDMRYWRPENGKLVLLNEHGEPINAFSYQECRAAIACDLAWKENREADSTVIMPAFITPSCDILVEHYICQKGMKPTEVADELFIMVERLQRLTHDSVPVGFEKAMLENVSQWLLRREMQARNRFLEIRKLEWDADKNTRIQTRLQPRYNQHVIFHRSNMGELEQQLVRFPYGAHDDLIDALQGLVQILQYPKAYAVEHTDDLFMRLRQFAIEQSRESRAPAKYGAQSKLPWQVIRSPL